MADDAAEQPPAGDGEDDLREEPAAPDTTPKLPYCYSIALLAGEGVQIEELQEAVAGLSGAGFQILTRDDIEGAAGEDEELAASVAASKEADPPAPIPPDVRAKLLHKIFREPAPEEPPELTAEGSVGKLVKVQHGPRCFKVFVNDFPASEDLATMEAALEGGALDCVVLVTAPPEPPPKPKEEVEGEDAVEPPPEPTDEEKAEKEKFIAAGRAREQVFADFQTLVGTETGAASARSHKVLADVCFETLQLTAKGPDAEGYCDAAASMEELGAKLLCIVKAKLEWLDWIIPLKRVETVPQDVNLRRYDEELAACPVSSLSVAIILNALLEQVETLHPDTDKTHLPLPDRGLGDEHEAGESDHDPAHAHSHSLANKAIESALESAIYSLNAPLPKRNEAKLSQRMDIPLDLHGDKQAQRVGAPKVSQVLADSLLAQENSVVKLVDDQVRACVPAYHPQRPGMTDAEVGLEMTELQTMLPAELSPSQIRRGLILAEMERLISFRADDAGEALDVNGWPMGEIDLTPYNMVEEHQAVALKQVLRECLQAPHSQDPHVQACYYARDDLVLAIVCNHVPFTRMQNFKWRAAGRSDLGEALVPCFLGFWQWLESRFAFRQEDADRRAAELQAIEAEGNALAEIVGAAPAAGEGGGEGGEAAELSEEEVEARRVAEEERKAEEAEEEERRQVLPSLHASPSGAWYEMDSKKARRVWEDRQVLYLSHGPRVCLTKTENGRVLTLDVGRHVAVMRQDSVASGYKLSLTYEDGACATAHREEGHTIVTLSLPEGILVTLRSDGTAWQSRPVSKPEKGVDAAAELKRMDWGARATAMDAVPKPRGQVLVEGDVGASLVDKAGVKACALVGDSNVVLWRADGECEILMPNACCAESLGPGCGWLWTNANGHRQIRGAPKAKHPLRAPPVSVKKNVQPESGEVLVSRGDYVMSVTRRDGTELVMHRDGTEMATYPAGADDAGPRRTIKVTGMAPIETGPNPRQVGITLQDGSTICLIPGLGGSQGLIEIRRRDGSVLQAYMQGGKVVFIAEGELLDLAEAAVGASDSKSRKSGASKAKSALDARSHRSGRSKADDAQSRGAGSVKSFKSGKSGKTEADAQEEKPPGTYMMSIVTGSFATADYAGNSYAINSKGEVKLVVPAQLALKKRNDDAISEADAARNRLAMEAGGMEDVRPPSPKIESAPPPRLEPYRLFVIRRDGSGYELVHQRIGRLRIKTAAEHGRTVVEEALPPEDEEAGAVSYTVLAPDHRYPLGGAAMGLKALSDELLPALFKHKGLASATDTGTVAGKPVPWTRLVLQKLVFLPPLSKEMMVILRRSLDKHQEWRREQEEIGDAHYITDTRAPAAVEKEVSLQDRILSSRKDANIAPASFGRRRSSKVHLGAGDGASSPLHHLPAHKSDGHTGGGDHAHAGSSSNIFHRGAMRKQSLSGSVLTEALSVYAGASAANTRPTTQGTAVSEDSDKEMEAVGRGVVFCAYPPVVNFGQVPAGCIYRCKVSILNAGIDYSKYRIRQPALSNVCVVYQPCQVAAGMSVVVWVEISAPVAGASIKDSFTILSEVKGDSFEVPIRATVAEADGLPMAGTFIDNEGQVEVVQQIAKTVTLSQMRSKPPVKESSNKLLRKTDGTNLGGTIHEVQTIGKNAKKQKALCSTGVLQG